MAVFGRCRRRFAVLLQISLQTIVIMWNGSDSSEQQQQQVANVDFAQQKRKMQDDNKN